MKPLSPLQHACISQWQSFDEAVDKFRLNMVIWALVFNKGNQAAAARQLNLTRQTLNNILWAHGLEPCQLKKDIIKRDTRKSHMALFAAVSGHHSEPSDSTAPSI